MHHQNKIGNLNILNSRETKHIVEKISEQYGCDMDFSGYAFLTNKDNRIYMITRDVDSIPYDEMKIDSLGMYLGEIYRESLRLSVEGSQVIGPHAKNNVIDISREQMVDWVKGNDIPVEEDSIQDYRNHFLIIRHTSGEYTDYYGAGKYKDGKVLNFVSKSRRLVVVNE